MKKLIIIILLFIFLLPNKNFAQQEKLFSYNLFPKNHYLYNPANTGDRKTVTAFINYRNRFTGINGAPEIKTFGVHGSVSENIGIGGLIISDKRGVLENLSANLSYSYRVKFEEKSNLFLGISGGFEERSINRSNIIADQQEDVVLIDGTNEGYNFDAGLGIMYKLYQFEVGISMPRISNQRFNALTSINLLMGDSKIELEPYFLYRMMENDAINNSQFDAGLILAWDKKIWTGFTYKSNSSYVALLGADIKPLSVAYSFEFGTEKITKVADGTHEVQLVYNFSLQKIQKIIATGGASSSTIDSLEYEIKTMRKDMEYLLKKFKKLKVNERKHLKDDIIRINNGRTNKYGEDLENSSNGVPRDLDKYGIANFTTDEMVKIGADDDGGELERGVYVVIHSFKTRKMAEEAVAMMKKDTDITAYISLNKRRSWYYVYTGVYKTRKEGVEKMYFERKRGFKDAWVFIY